MFRVINSAFSFLMLREVLFLRLIWMKIKWCRWRSFIIWIKIQWWRRRLLLFLKMNLLCTLILNLPNKNLYRKKIIFNDCTNCWIYWMNSYQWILLFFQSMVAGGHYNNNNDNNKNFVFLISFHLLWHHHFLILNQIYSHQIIMVIILFVGSVLMVYHQ